MFGWLEANIVSCVIVGLVAVICAVIIIRGVRNIAKGKSSCGCGCSGCAASMNCAVHELEKYQESKH
ncbi:MAG: hypothetical protein ACTTJ2_06240 [Anaerovoracaceae bacterium]